MVEKYCKSEVTTRKAPPENDPRRDDLAAARGITNSIIIISIIGWAIIVTLVVIALWPLRPWQ